MGSCFSSTVSGSSNPPTAKVLALDGSLTEYPVTVKVSHVLSPHHSSCFLRDSDTLYYDTHITALGSDESLQLGHLYFVLPVAKLESPLTGPDMAALAVKATLALASASRSHGRRQKLRVMPDDEVDEEHARRDGELDGFTRLNELSVGVSRSKPAPKKVGRLGAARVSFRARMSTIDEVPE